MVRFALLVLIFIQYVSSNPSGETAVAVSKCKRLEKEKAQLIDAYKKLQSTIYQPAVTAAHKLFHIGEDLPKDAASEGLFGCEENCQFNCQICQAFYSCPFCLIVYGPECCSC